MSRGIGALQRKLVELLDVHGRLDTITLAALAYDVQPDEHGSRLVSEAQHAATRRALRALHRQGMVVDLTRSWHGSNRRQWASLKVGLPIRLRYLQQCNALAAARGDAAAIYASVEEIVAIQERMGTLGISVYDA